MKTRYILTGLWLALYLSGLSGCRFIPGGDGQLHYFTVRQNGQATITRVIHKADNVLIDFNWRSSSAPDQLQKVSGLNIREITAYEQLPQITAGMQLRFQVERYFRQYGSTTPREYKNPRWEYIPKQ